MTARIIDPTTNSSALDRRTLLKSTGIFLGTSALAGGASSLSVGMDTSSSRSPGNGAKGTLDRQMIGFMLPHEQFPVQQLLEFAVTAESAGFDLLATSDH